MIRPRMKIRRKDVERLLEEEEYSNHGGDDGGGSANGSTPVPSPSTPMTSFSNERRSGSEESRGRRDGSIERYPDGSPVQYFPGSHGDAVPHELRELLKKMCDPQQHLRPTIEHVCARLRTIASL
jgi:hypothetical protein